MNFIQLELAAGILALLGICFGESVDLDKKSDKNCIMNWDEMAKLEQTVSLLDNNEMQKSTFPVDDSEGTTANNCTKTFQKLLSTIAEISTLPVNETSKFVEIVKIRSMINTWHENSAPFEINLDDLRNLVRTLDIEAGNKLIEKSLQKVSLKIQSGEIKVAKKEFSALKNRRQLVSDLIKAIYMENFTSIDNIMLFVDQLKEFKLEVVAFGTLFEEMKLHGHLKEKQLMYLFCLVLQLIEDRNFSTLKLNLKNEYYKLKKDMEPHAQIMLESFESDISTQSWDNLKKMHKYLGSNLTGYFAEKLGKQYYESHTEFDTLTVLKALHNYMLKLPYYFNNCYLLEAVYEAMKVNGSHTSWPAFYWWLEARFVMYRYKGDEGSRGSIIKCKIVVDDFRPEEKIKYLDQFVSMFQNQTFVRSAYRANIFPSTRSMLPDLIRSLNLDNYKYVIKNLIELIYALPRISDTCVALAAVQEKLETLDKLNEYQNFQILRIAQSMMKQQNYKTIPDFFKGKCELVKRRSPEAFVQILWRKSSDCVLVNRFYDSPSFCSGEFNTSSQENFQYRDTWIPADDAGRQTWKILLSSDGKFQFRSNKYTSWHLNHKKGFAAPYESHVVTDESDDLWWSIAAVDDKYIILRSVTDGTYITADDDAECEQRENRCCTEIAEYTPDLSAKMQWKLKCN